MKNNAPVYKVAGYLLEGLPRGLSPDDIFIGRSNGLSYKSLTVVKRGLMAHANCFGGFISLLEKIIYRKERKTWS